MLGTASFCHWLYFPAVWLRSAPAHPRTKTIAFGSVQFRKIKRLVAAEDEELVLRLQRRCTHRVPLTWSLCIMHHHWQRLVLCLESRTLPVFESSPSHTNCTLAGCPWHIRNSLRDFRHLSQDTASRTVCKLYKLQLLVYYESFSYPLPLLSINSFECLDTNSNRLAGLT